MTKAEYLSAFGRELKRLGVADAGDVLEEYEQHFEFKGRDGCTEEEISARLGDPAALAAQFAGTGTASGSGALTAVGLSFMWIFAALFFCAAGRMGDCDGGVCHSLRGLCRVPGRWRGRRRDNSGYAVLLRPVVCLSPGGPVRAERSGYGLLRAVRARRCALLDALCAQHARLCRGGAALPALPVAPRLPAARAWRARRVALAALAVFAACFVLGAVVSMLSAGSIQFWHAWHWFGYGA